MRVCLVGNGAQYHVGAFFRSALRTLGFQYTFVDEQVYTKKLKGSLLHRVAYKLLKRRPLTYWAFNRDLLETARKFRPEVVLVTKGVFVSPETLTQIKEETKAILVNYATDDPFNPEVSTRDLVASIPFYDLYACTKRAIMDDVRGAGCSHVIYAPFGYEPSLHFSEHPGTEEEKASFASDVVFIGGGDSDRIPLIRALTTIPNLRLHLYGGYWDRDPTLRRFHRGFALGREYRLALGGARIALSLVRRANRDGHSMRTFEIPACRAFMLAERTEEHLEMFDEDKEAAFFGSAEELVKKVQTFLLRDADRACIAEAGWMKVVNNGNSYQNRLLQILRSAKASS